MELFLDAQLVNNQTLVIILLIFILANILACCRNGIFACTAQLTQNTRNERIFADMEVRFGKIRGVLYIQYFLFMGLCLCYALSPDPIYFFNGINTFSPDSFLFLLACLSAPILWSLFHYILYHWIVFFFGGGGSMIIMDRIYKSLHLLAGPLPMLLFLAVVTMGISQNMTTFLLSAIFILTQIAFVFSSFKVFFNGLGSLYLFLVYLCTLELAPLAVIFVKFGHIEI